MNRNIRYKELYLISDTSFLNSTPNYVYHCGVNSWDEKIDKSMLPITSGTWWDIMYYPAISSEQYLLDSQTKMIAINSEGALYIKTHTSSGWQAWQRYVVYNDLIATQYKATLLNGWFNPYGDNNLITYKIGNLYMMSGVICSPSTITENTYDVANLNLPFNFTGQGCVNIGIKSDNRLYLTSYNDGILHDQYRQAVPDTEYMIKGFFIH